MKEKNVAMFHSDIFGDKLRVLTRRMKFFVVLQFWSIIPQYSSVSEGW